MKKKEKPKLKIEFVKDEIINFSEFTGQILALKKAKTCEGKNLNRGKGREINK